MPAQIAPPRPKSSLRTTTTTNTAPAPPRTSHPSLDAQAGSPVLNLLPHPHPYCVIRRPLRHLPRPLRLQFMTDLRTYYIRTYRDQFSISPPAWFTAYMWMEALYHLPMSVWAVRNLVVGTHPLLPLHLLLFAAQTGITTLTCVVDMVSWTGTSWAVKRALGWLYGPYLALCECFPVPPFPLDFGGETRVWVGLDVVGLG
ncbi:MAG: Integral membrane [Lasallia pustulata]|uniref:Integral membrane n=1 Tax=Lasallia pustulata TaxID=136370 RepID=A0A5M8PXM0_9LECA|nr:MAG: Integral membrane [Lasallia pustulata]